MRMSKLSVSSVRSVQPEPRRRTCEAAAIIDEKEGDGRGTARVPRLPLCPRVRYRIKDFVTILPIGSQVFGFAEGGDDGRRPSPSRLEKAPCSSFKISLSASPAAPLLEEASVVIPTALRRGSRPQRHRKTTLFARHRRMGRRERFDPPRAAKIGQVAQEALARRSSLLDSCSPPPTRSARARFAEAETATDPTRIGEIHTRLADIGAHSAEARAATTSLSGLGFSHEAQARPCSISAVGGCASRSPPCSSPSRTCVLDDD